MYTVELSMQALRQRCKRYELLKGSLGSSSGTPHASHVPARHAQVAYLCGKVRSRRSLLPASLDEITTGAPVDMTAAAAAVAWHQTGQPVMEQLQVEVPAPCV
jgi:hypothetical protein